MVRPSVVSSDEPYGVPAERRACTRSKIFFLQAGPWSGNFQAEHARPCESSYSAVLTQCRKRDRRGALRGGVLEHRVSPRNRLSDGGEASFAATGDHSLMEPQKVAWTTSKSSGRRACEAPALEGFDLIHGTATPTPSPRWATRLNAKSHYTCWCD